MQLSGNTCPVCKKAGFKLSTTKDKANKPQKTYFLEMTTETYMGSRKMNLVFLS